VKAFFTAPTAFRAIKREDPRGEKLGQHDLTGLRTLFLAGERCDPDTLNWAGEQLGVPVIDNWWQTETGWPIAANCVGLGSFPVRPGSCGKAIPGYEVRIFDDHGHETPRGTMGNVVLKLPLPPGCLPTLWNKDEEYRENYLTTYPGYYQTSDAGYQDADDYLWLMGRTDDIINVAGHRLSTGGLEEVLASHADIAECAVIGVADSVKGEVPLGLVVLKAGATTPHDRIAVEVIRMIRETIGPVASFKQVMVVKRLPKTRSGKIVRGTVKKIADGVAYQMPPSIEDPAVIFELVDALKAFGYPTVE
jgi:propionyl-CoA synthetase